MNKKEAINIMNKIKDIMDEYPNIAYGVMIYDEENAALGGNNCMRCVNEKLSLFLDENDIKHDVEYSTVDDIPNQYKDTKH